ncbi:hypothetical protein ACIP5Z_11640 [Rothia terrae]
MSSLVRVTRRSYHPVVGVLIPAACALAALGLIVDVVVHLVLIG